MKQVTTPANIIMLLVLFFITFRLDSKDLSATDPEADMKDYFQVSPWEEIYLHIDRNKYIAGEDIWFSIYTIDMETEKLSSRSLVAYVELLNPWNIPVIRKRLKLTGGRGEGNFTLPDSITSGTYTIRAYTNWMKNFLPDNCYIRDIEIVNPFRNSDFWRKEGLMTNLKTEETVAQHEKRSTFSINGDSVFGRRENVTFNLQAGNNIVGQSHIYDLSISVTPAKVSQGHQGIDDYILSRQPICRDVLSGVKTPPKYRFESDGHYLSVIIKYREDKITDSSEYLYMSIQGKVAEFRYASRDTAGRFNLLLPVDDKFRNLILQPEHANNNMIPKFLN